MLAFAVERGGLRPWRVVILTVPSELRARRLAAMRFHACLCRIDAYIDPAFGRICLGRDASWLQ